MPFTPLAPGLVEATDSYEEWCVARVQTINPARQCFGMVMAADWPVEDIVAEAFYLLVLGSVEVPGIKSASVPIYVHTLQWTWLILGNDITQGVRGRNRGDKYRTVMQMRNELRYAQFPQYAPKQQWTPDPTTGGLTAVPLDPHEFIWWKKLVFRSQTDKDTGNVYEMATVEVSDMTPIITE